MNFLDFNDDVKIIIAKHCTSDYFISTMFISRQNVCLLKKNQNQDVIGFMISFTV
jgi:hypothetical protein